MSNYWIDFLAEGPSFGKTLRSGGFWRKGRKRASTEHKPFDNPSASTFPVIPMTISWGSLEALLTHLHFQTLKWLMFFILSICAWMSVASWEAVLYAHWLLLSPFELFACQTPVASAYKPVAIIIRWSNEIVNIARKKSEKERKLLFLWKLRWVI